jgi:hypothetical protein
MQGSIEIFILAFEVLVLIIEEETNEDEWLS